MHALIIYESMFGNTQAIANAIAEGLSTRMRVDITEVGVAPQVLNAEINFLIVGAPTHQFGLSRPSSREQAARQAPGKLVSAGVGVREWLDTLPGQPETVVIAAFDTVLTRPRWLRLVGSAARSIEKRLKRRGFRVVAPHQSFYVAGSAGPLETGELERARRWGEKLGDDVAASWHERSAA